MRISDWSSDVCSSDLNVIARIGHPAVERHLLARMGRLLPDEGVDIGDKLGRRAVAKGADAVDEERLALWKNGRHRIVAGSCDRIAVQPPAPLRLAPADGHARDAGRARVCADG